jgi:exoribonuclease R
MEKITAQILIENREYSKWSFVNPETGIEIENNMIPSPTHFEPSELKLFTKDVVDITIQNPSKIDILISPIRNLKYIAGVLILDGNKTYGRTENKKRLLYKCIPDDKHLPAFLVPYDVKLGFFKSNENKYVIFKYENWNDKHPRGIILETLGDVSVLNVFYEYQLYCKSLHASLADFTKKTRETLNKTSMDEYIERILKNPNYQIEDRKHEYIFTIDPANSEDFDDGFGVVELPDGRCKVSIYIAQVYFWLDTLDLWDSFSKRVSTIYLPDQRRPMLPTILSDNLCSLQKGEPRFAVVLDIIIDEKGNIVEDEIKYKNVFIKVKKNYVYEKLMDNKYYNKLFDITTKLDETVKDSHDVVAYWMIKMNEICGKIFKDKQMGIFRTSKYQQTEQKYVNQTMSDNIRRVINHWNNVSGKYVLYDEGCNTEHEVMNISSYIHITSPIRRIVDLLNQMMMIHKLGLIQNISKRGEEFLNDWLKQIDYINVSMKSIRKIQTDCNVLHRCYTDENIMEKIYNGVVFDKTEKMSGMNMYMVYLEELNLLSRITTINNIDNYSKISCRLYLFEDEDKIKKKIRLQMTEN